MLITALSPSPQPLQRADFQRVASVFYGQALSMTLSFYQLVRTYM
jgi:hypothetical protein